MQWLTIIKIAAGMLDQLPSENIDSAAPPRGATMRSPRFSDGQNLPRGQFVECWDPKQIASAIGGWWDAYAKATATLVVAGTEIWGKFARDAAQFQAAYGLESYRALMNYMNGWNQAYTEERIAQWVDIDAETHTKEDDTSPGGRYYIYVKEQLQKSIDTLPEPARTLTRQFILTNKWAQDLLRSDQMAGHFETIDDTIRRVYERKYPEKIAHMRWHGLLFDPKYNHKFLAEDSRGNIVEVTQEQVASWFPKGAKKFPHVMITYSHAQGEAEDDVRSMIHGYASQALHSSDGERHLSLKHVDQPIGPDDTVIIYACDVRESPWKNGADLIRRVNELKRIGNKRDTQFNFVSPGAIRAGKLMLKCKAEHPEDIDAQDMTLAPVTDSVLAERGHVTLRSDAGIISHRFQPLGFSKGGNVSSDTGRYSNFALTSKKADSAECFRMSPDNPVCQAANDFSMSTRNVRNMNRGHAYFADAAVEVGLSDWDIEHGMVRRAANNEYDAISAHQNYLGDQYRDHRLIVKGTTDHHGHAPSAFLGSKKKSRENLALTREMFERGYKLDDKDGARLSFEYFASNYGKAAIGHVSFKEGAEEGTIILEPAPGTLDSAVMDHAEKIKKILTNALGKKVELVENILEPGRIKLVCKGADFVNNPDALRRLQEGFEELQKPKVKGLVIANEIIKSEIQAQLELARMNSRVKFNPGKPGIAA